MAATAIGAAILSDVLTIDLQSIHLTFDHNVADRVVAHCRHSMRAPRRSPRLLILPSLSLPPLEFCLGTNPIQAEKSRPDRKALGSATLETSAVAKTGPTPGISSSRRLVSLDRCQALIIRSNSRIYAFSIRNWSPRAATHARATSSNRLSFESAATPSSWSTPWRPTGATIRTRQDGRGWH
jgi:hypothetical protein